LSHGWQSRSYSGSRALDASTGSDSRADARRDAALHALPQRPRDRRDWHESELVTVLGEAGGGPVCLVGVHERGEAFGVVYLRREPDGVQIEVELRLDAVLEPGEQRAPGPVHLALGSDASALLEDFAEAYGGRAGARVFRPFLARWCTGRHAPCDADGGDDALRRDLETLVELRDEIPIDVVQIGEGWQRAVGDWLETDERFARGLAPLAAEIREAGFIPGLWTAPLCVVSESEVFGKHGDWLLREGRDPLRAFAEPGWAADGAVYALDTGRRDVAEHLERVFRELVDMGFLYLNLDFLYAAALPATSVEPRLGRAGRLRRGLQAVRAGAGEEAFLLGDRCPLGAAVGLVDGMRTGPDATSSPFGADAGPDDVPLPHAALRNALTRSWMHRRLWVNDSGPPPPDAATAFASCVAGSGSSPLLAGDPARHKGAGGGPARVMLETARAVDGAGIPCAARAIDPLAAEIPQRLTAPDMEGETLVLLNTGEAPAQRALALDPRDRNGRPIAAVEPRIGNAAAASDGADVHTLDPGTGLLLCVRREFPLAVFCDFDGTFSVQDVGSTLAVRHAGSLRPEAWQRYERGEIRAWDYNMEILDGLEVPISALETFLHTVELDPGARDLLAWCEERGAPFRILSDGFDWNLNRLQGIHAVRFAYAANHLHYERGRWRIRPGQSDAGCECGTGTCKGSILRAFRTAHPRAMLVHIGNGRVSDTCGALAADLAFAKDSLAVELERRGAPFEPYATLHDVIPLLERSWQRVSVAPTD
jgi:2,3-diketo-5-methylthio-1-phosphopentane phosphatase